MNPSTHKTHPAVVDVAIAECRHYLPVVACFGFVSLVLYVLSGLHFN
jgi:hypothetical protein